VTVKGNVVSCDTCGQQLSMLTALKHAAKCDLEDGARAYAAGWGWDYTPEGDYCPDHRVKVTGPPARDRAMARLRSPLGRKEDSVEGTNGVPVTPASILRARAMRRA
jgi:hypothetical protein